MVKRGHRHLRHYRHNRQRGFIGLFCLALFVVILTGGLKAATDTYIAGVEDLPLMPGLTEKIEDRVIFDTPEGRILEAITWGAVGTVSASAVKTFYRNTLPQLGWHPEKFEAKSSRESKAESISFAREGERLLIEFSPGSGASSKMPVEAQDNHQDNHQGNLIVRFTIRPHIKP